MTIRIASRSSKLALKQVEIFSKAFLLEDYKLVEVLTSGDKMSAKIDQKHIYFWDEFWESFWHEFWRKNGPKKHPKINENP